MEVEILCGVSIWRSINYEGGYGNQGIDIEVESQEELIRCRYGGRISGGAHKVSIWRSNLRSGGRGIDLEVD
jgi:hypothetical protein